MIMLRYTEKAKDGGFRRVKSPAGINMGNGASSGVVYPDSRSVSYKVGPNEAVVFRLNEDLSVSRLWYKNGNYGMILDKKRSNRRLSLAQAVDSFGTDVRLGLARLYICESDPEVRAIKPGFLPQVYVKAFGKIGETMKVPRDDIFKVLRRFAQMAQYCSNVSGQKFDFGSALPSAFNSGVTSNFPTEEAAVFRPVGGKVAPSKVRGMKSSLRSTEKGGAKIGLDEQIRNLRVSLARQKMYLEKARIAGDETQVSRWTGFVAKTERKISEKLAEKKQSA